MRHLFFFYHIISFLAGFTCLGFALFVYKLKKDVRIKYFALVFLAYMFIMLEQTITSYTFANSIRNSYVSFISLIASSLGCVLTVYYLPVFAFSFTNTVFGNSVNKIIKGLTGTFVVSAILYHILQIKLFLMLVGNVVLIISIAYSLIIFLRQIKSGADDKGRRVIRKYLFLTAVFLPYMIIDMRIERIKGIGEKFPYGIFSVPMFLIALSSLTLYYGYKEFKKMTTTTKGVEDKPSAVADLEEKKQKNIEGFYQTYNITKREREIIELLIKGYSYNRISEELVVTLPTVKSHVYNIYQKTGVKSKIELLNLMKT